MALTGRPGGPPAYPSGGLMAGLEALRGRLEAASAALGCRVEAGLPELLSGRAALLGLSRAGGRSAGGSAWLLPCADGWVALSLARTSDTDSVPAFLALLGAPADVRGPAGMPAAGEVAAVSAAVVTAPGVRVLEAAELLGLPVALVPPCRDGASVLPGHRAAWVATPLPRTGKTAAEEGRERPGRLLRAGPLVVDLSSLWAGPLCAYLLGRAGCRVVKVEDPSRLDGARRGDPRFWHWLQDGHESRLIPFASGRGYRELAGLLGQADVVIEASRARALDQLGLGPGQIAAKPGAVWATITGYGRADSRVAFGDDAAAGGGLVAWDEAGPMFCGDAMADPVAGLTAAVGVAEALAAGGGVHLDVSMVEAVAAAVAAPACLGAHQVAKGASGWEATCSRFGRSPVVPPVSPVLP